MAIQDADSEYHPGELRKLIKPLLGEDADVVLGSTFLTSEITECCIFGSHWGMASSPSLPMAMETPDGISRTLKIPPV